MAPPSKLNTKFRPPKITTQTLLDFDLEESSSDSDFRIEDHDESDDDFSDNSNAVDSGKDDDDGDDDSDSDEDSKSDFSDFRASLLGKVGGSKGAESDVKSVLEAAKAAGHKENLPTNPICCACLGDRSDDTNEIVECDGCGVCVHEMCYGVSDSTSVSSTISSCSTEPWFCEACRAGVSEPSCELCPNVGGIFKETDVGKWVHLVCALYVPGVAFGEVDQLSSVTLFEMPYSKWGAKTCSLCEDAKYARTGVCIGCDAGMCKTYFHVTCAQAAGFLSEAHSEEADHADPFYAHCKVHSDKTMIKHRKRNFNTLKLRMERKKLVKIENQMDKPTTEQLRIQRKLSKHQTKYRLNKMLKTDPWVPTQKMPRLLSTSATACKRLLLKAELMGIDTAALEFQEAQMAALADVRKKWHIPPAFSVEFIGYYLDRIARLKDLKCSLERNIISNKKLLEEQQVLRDEYDKKIKLNTETTAKNTALKEQINELHKQILSLCPSKILHEVSNIGQPAVVPSPQPSAPSARPMSVPTAAALKMGVGFPLTNLPGTKDDTGRILSTQRMGNDELVHACGICKRCNDQHMLAKCDTCHFYYHLGCLNPPLTRHPKKSKLYGWQCSECDKSDDSDGAVDIPKGPRKSRTRFSKDGTIVPVDPNLSTSSTDGNVSLKADSISATRKSIDKAPVKEKASQPEVAAASTNGKLTIKEISLMAKTSSIPPSLVKSVKKAKHSTSLKKFDPETNEKSAAPKNYEPTSNKEIKPKNELVKSPKPPAADIVNNSKVEADPLAVTLPPSPKKENKLKLAKKIKKDKTEQTMPDRTDATSSQGNSESVPLKTDPTNKPNDEKVTKDEHTEKKNSTESTVDQIHKQNRKRRKEKHKNKYGSDNEKSPTKEHKRKRKKKNHDMENPNDTVPKIKIKFRTLPLPGEIAPEPHFFYVSADMVRPMDTSRPTSVETVDDSTMNADDIRQNFSPTEDKNMASTSTPNSDKITNHVEVGPQVTPKSSLTISGAVKPGRITSPRKSNKRDSTNTSIPEGRSATTSICDVCHNDGTNQNLVKCDECQKNYHFTCLDPPLKKTPKKRGYSWHCADCDPTDLEST